MARTQESTGGGPGNQDLGPEGSKLIGTRQPMMTLYVRQISARPARRWITAWAGSSRLALPPPLPDSPARSALPAGTPARLFPPTRLRSMHTVPQQLPEPHEPPDPTDSAA